MKKLILFFAFAVSLTACSLEDDGPVYEQKLAKVVETDLPTSFIRGNTYKIDVVYMLPDACHSPLGVTANRAGLSGDERRKIYVAGVTTREVGATSCDQQSEDLEVESSFSIIVDEAETYTFYLWQGVDAKGEGVYTVVEVPVEQSGSTPN